MLTRSDRIMLKVWQYAKHDSAWQYVPLELVKYSGVLQMKSGNSEHIIRYTKINDSTVEGEVIDVVGRVISRKTIDL